MRNFFFSSDGNDRFQGNPLPWGGNWGFLFGGGKDVLQSEPGGGDFLRRYTVKNGKAFGKGGGEWATTRWTQKEAFLFAVLA